ncbi:MAG: 23S rRNA (adenine(2030)-N(6))-methyltransferase RlmJ [Janthinobacterium lividum]
MNYRHIYHAGNFADIVKHLVLIEVLRNFLKKDKPFAVLDAFAGCGLYNISSEQALCTKESASGIERLFILDQYNQQKPQLIELFLSIVQRTGSQNLYPGSPIIIKNLIRQDDRFIACELHKQDYQYLRQLIPDAHNIDAYKAIKVFLPFKEKRGLIFLDPPFEVKDEFDKLLDALKIIRHRSINTCCIIWHPIKEENTVNSFYVDLKTLGFVEILKIEFEILGLSPTIDLENNRIKKPLSKCGLLIINPPNVQEELALCMKYLVRNIYKDKAICKVELL